MGGARGPVESKPTRVGTQGATGHDGGCEEVIVALKANRALDVAEVLEAGDVREIRLLDRQGAADFLERGERVEVRDGIGHRPTGDVLDRQRPLVDSASAGSEIVDFCLGVEGKCTCVEMSHCSVHRSLVLGQRRPRRGRFASKLDRGAPLGLPSTRVEKLPADLEFHTGRGLRRGLEGLDGLRCQALLGPQRRHHDLPKQVAKISQK